MSNILRNEIRNLYEQLEGNIKQIQNLKNVNETMLKRVQEINNEIDKLDKEKENITVEEIKNTNKNSIVCVRIVESSYAKNNKVFEFEVGEVNKEPRDDVVLEIEIRYMYKNGKCYFTLDDDSKIYVGIDELFKNIIEKFKIYIRDISLFLDNTGQRELFEIINDVF